MTIAHVPMVTYGNIEKEIQKISIFAEADQCGLIFLKVEGSNGVNNTMIFCQYDIEKGMEDFINLTRELIQKQIVEIKEKIKDSDYERRAKK